MSSIAETFSLLISFDGVKPEDIDGRLKKESELPLTSIMQGRKQSLEETFREVERIVLLRNVDTKWMDHIDAMDQLKQESTRAIGNEDPVRALVEGFDMLEEMTEAIQEDTVKMLMRVRLRKNCSENK